LCCMRTLSLLFNPFMVVNLVRIIVLQLVMPNIFLVGFVFTETEPFVFRGEETVKIFLERLEMYAKMYYELTRPKNAVPIIITREDKHNFANTSVCHICEKHIDEKKVREPKAREREVQDHCHITEKYRVPAHEYCNLNYKYPKFIPLYFHNLSGYDAHLFIKELAEYSPHMNTKSVSIIPSNEENYLSFSKDFVVDSFTKKVR